MRRVITFLANTVEWMILFLMFSFVANIYWTLWKEAPLLKPRVRTEVPARVATRPVAGGYVQKIVIKGFTEPYGITEAPGGTFFVSDFQRDRNQGKIFQIRMKEAEEEEKLPQPEPFATSVSLIFPADIQYYEGFLYVVEHSRRVGVWKISLADGSGEFYNSFSGAGEFLEPRALTIDAKTGEIFVADRGKGKIWHFHRTWEVKELWAPPSSVASLFTPNGIFISSRTSPIVYVTDKKNRKVFIYKPESRELRFFGSMGVEKQGEFYTPTGVTEDASGKIYVADYTRNLLQVFSSEGKFLFALGPEEIGDSEFAEPKDVLIDSNGFLWITGGKYPKGKIWRIALPQE